MSIPIINKVAESGLISLDLANFIPPYEIIVFDIKPFLFKELILKEKDFRTALASIEWEGYKNKIVGIYCSVEVIIPIWANMLIVSYLAPFVKAVYFGNEDQVREQAIIENIQHLNTADYVDQRVVVKGCGEVPIGEAAYIAITQKLQPVVKSLMYGEPCSTVPIYKKKA